MVNFILCLGDESDDEQAPEGDGRDATYGEQVLKDAHEGDAEAELEDAVSSEDLEERRGAGKKGNKVAAGAARKKRHAASAM